MAFNTFRNIVAIAAVALFGIVHAQTPVFTSASAQRTALNNELSFNVNNIDPTMLAGGVTAQPGNVAGFPSLALPDVNIAFNKAFIPAGQEFPIHIHPRGTELIFNLIGEQRTTITLENGEPLVFDTKPGTYTAIPEGLPHITACVGKQDCMFTAAFNTADPGTLFLGGNDDTDDAPDVSPAGSPNVVPDVAPDATPDVTPDATSSV